MYVVFTSIGQLTFKEAGVFTLNFKPASAATWRPPNLKNVMLNGNEN
jgi:hypothetical protein